MTRVASTPTPARGLKQAAGFVLAGLLLAPGAALAHGSAPGLAGFISGFVHPLVEPAHLIALIAFVLLIGQQGFKATHPGLPALCIAAGIGLLAAGLGWRFDTDIELLACAAVSGIAVAVGRPWPRVVYVIAGCLIGLGIGLASAPDGPRGGAMIATMLGTWAGVCVWATNGSALVDVLKRPWLRVLIRVVASWMAACAVLFLALSVAPKRPGSAPPISTPGSLDVRR